jgi:tRNA 2-thiouridine synthesizing protein A
MAVKADETLDCKGLSCPMPILKLAQTMKKMKKGQTLELLATDPGSKPDVPAWCKKTGHKLLDTGEDSGVYKYYIKCMK